MGFKILSFTVLIALACNYTFAQNNFPAPVGIGTTSPTSPLHVVSSESNTYVPLAEFYAPSNTTTGNSSQIRFGQGASSNNASEWRFVYQGSGSGYNRTDFGYWGSANPVFSYLANGNMGVGTSSPLSRLTVKSSNVPTYGILSVQDENGSGASGQAFVSFFGADNGRLGYFGPSYGYFVIQNDQSNKVAISPGTLGKVSIGTDFITDHGTMFQVSGTSYLQGNVGTGGRLGVGTASPIEKLEAKGTIFSSNTVNNSGIYISGDIGNFGVLQATNGTNSASKNLILQHYGGNVGIGTSNPGNFKLAVEGHIGARKLIVKQSAWADYVFDESYKLSTLKEVEEFIRKNKHLPDVPSAKQIEREGLDVGDNQAILLKKIEELTLYMIDLQKQVDTQKKEIENLKTQKAND